MNWHRAMSAGYRPADTPRLCCPACKAESSVYARADVRWNPARGVWELLHIEEQLDCTECDHAWPLDGSAFPQIAPRDLNLKD